jgi:hypothetical protein
MRQNGAMSAARVRLARYLPHSQKTIVIRLIAGGRQ